MAEDPSTHSTSSGQAGNVAQRFGAGLGGVLRLFQGGAEMVANAIQSGDRAIGRVDGALTGNDAPPPEAAPSSLEQLQERVFTLVRQGREAINRTGNARSPEAVTRFGEAMRLIFQAPLSAAASGDPQQMARPSEIARQALSGLRSSMAMIRLANGQGTPDDVVDVIAVIEDAPGRMRAAQEAASAVAAAAQSAGTRAPVVSDATRTGVASAPAGYPGVAPAPAVSDTTPRRAQRRPTGASSQGSEATARFAEALGAETGERRFGGYADRLRSGRATPRQVMSWITSSIRNGKYGAPNELTAAAEHRAGLAGAQATSPNAVRMARAAAGRLGNPEISQAVDRFAAGNLTEPELVAEMRRHASEDEIQEALAEAQEHLRGEA